MDVLLFSLRIYAATLFLVLAAGYLLISRADRLSRWFAYLCIADVCYLILGTSLRQSAVPLELGGLIYPLATLTSMAAGIFMIWTWRLTQDAKRFPVSLLAAFALQMSLELVNMACREGEHCIAGYGVDYGLGRSVQLVADVIEFGFLSLAIVWTVSGINSDVVNGRRRMRMILLLPLYVAIAVLEFVPIWFFSGRSLESIYFALNTGIFAAIASLLAYLSLVSRFEHFQALSRVAPNSLSIDGPDPTLVEDRRRFDETFVAGKLHRDPALTVARLARAMDIPQYRLRRLIHETLGFRNFNDLLNRSRIDDFCEQALHVENADARITSLAFDAGFSSITTFNDAFRRIRQMTPTEFRRRVASCGSTQHSATAGKMQPADFAGIR
jgi:AraC-like DNA-binding protein